MSPTEAATLRFGPFTLDAAAARLWRDGEPVELAPKSFDLLAFLAGRPGTLVTKDELLDGVWGHRFITEGVIKTAVSALRAALGDDAREPRWIETVPRRGYRFVGPVRIEAASPPRVEEPADGLPLEPTPLIGRHDELAALLAALADQRLVVVVGPSGVGKSRLALAAAREARRAHPDGARFVELAPLAPGSGPDRLRASIAQALQLPPAAADSDASLARALVALRALIVLDNAEHLIEPVAALVAAIVAQPGAPTLLVTSQQPLALAEEHLFRLGPLTLPQSGAPTAEHHGAVHLFVDRVAARLPGFRLTEHQGDAVVEICRALDGLPLALELAAARVPTLGIHGVFERLGDAAESPAAARERLALLSKGQRAAPARHRSLREALDWSHALLTPEQQRVFRRLAVFRGDFTIDAARQVAADAELDDWGVIDAIDALVDRSLLMPVHDAGSVSARLRLLRSPAALAAEQLHATGEADLCARRHAMALADRFEAADATYLATPALVWCAALMPEIDDLRAALDWAFDAQEHELALRLVAASAGLWVVSGMVREGEALVLRARERLDAATPPKLAARLWFAIAQIGGSGYSERIAPPLALAATRRALALYEELGSALHCYWAINFLIPLAERAGETIDVPALIARMRALEQPEWNALVTRLRRGTEARQLGRLGRWSEYRDAFRDQVEWLESLGELRGSWLAAQSLALAEIRLGRADSAIEVMERSVAQIRQSGRLQQIWTPLAMLAMARIEKGDPDRAAPVVAEAVRVLNAAGAVAWDIDHMANFVAQCGDLEGAALLHGWSIAKAGARSEARGPGIREAHERLARDLSGWFDAEARARLLQQGAQLRDDEVAARVLRAAATRARVAS